MTNETRKIYNKLRKKDRIKIADIISQDDGYIVFASDGYIFDSSDDILIELPYLSKSLLKQCALDCKNVKCKTCLRRGTSRCTKKCDNFLTR